MRSILLVLQLSHMKRLMKTSGEMELQCTWCSLQINFLRYFCIYVFIFCSAFIKRLWNRLFYICFTFYPVCVCVYCSVMQCCCELNKGIKTHTGFQHLVALFSCHKNKYQAGWHILKANKIVNKVAFLWGSMKDVFLTQWAVWRVFIIFYFNGYFWNSLKCSVCFCPLKLKNI